MISKMNLAKGTRNVKTMTLLATLALISTTSGQSVDSSRHSHNQLYRLEDASQSAFLADSSHVNRVAASSPGHYEFEVAPKMEPPSVRKPPYHQSSQSCPGTDLFAGFSPRDTLCGDLNQGRVPLNPLGQSVAGQAYPFELIKNKTLQFLARALPVLKLDYETIPKVARYLPANHLLNPTHQESPLIREHMNHLNRRFAANTDGRLANSLLRANNEDSVLYNPALGSSILSDEQPLNDDLIGTSYLRRKRRSISQPQLTVAELSSNATLVVSSAHSSNGRIGAGVYGRLNGTSVVTKDGYRPVSYTANNKIAAAQRSSGQSWPPAGLSTAATSLSVSSHDSQASNRKIEPENSSTKMAAINIQVNNSDSEKRQNRVQSDNLNNATPTGVPNSSPTPTSVANQADPQSSVVKTENRTNQASSSNDSRAQARSSNGNTATDTSRSVSDSASSNANRQVNSQSQTGGGSHKIEHKRSGCSDLSGGFTSVICQAVSALVEGEDRAPTWLQIAKHLGNSYSGATESFSGAPIWSLLTGLTSTDSLGNAKSANSGPSSGSLNSLAHKTKTNLLMPLMQIASYLSGAYGQPGTKDSSSHSSHESSSTNLNRADSQVGPLASTMTKLALAGWATNALASLVNYLAPTALSSASRSFAKRKNPFDSQETFVDTPASLAATASANMKQLSFGQTKQPPTPCPSVEEYISPTFARNYQGAWKYVVQIPHEGYFTQTIQKTSCARQKCEFTDGVCHESPRWVSLLVAEIYYPNAVFESPAAAAETIGQSQFVNAFNGDSQVANNLVAAASGHNIQQVAGSNQQQLPGVQQNPQAPNVQQKSSSSVAPQDPLQMADSLSAYNHNLNSAFINAANELGLDPTNVAHMQQLANAHNYQLLQRNGLLAHLQQPQQQPQQQQVQKQRQVAAESRSGPQPEASQTNPQNVNSIFAGYSNDYILSLAASALQQNPNLSINELIATLQTQLAHKRRRRDVMNQFNQRNQRQQQQLNYDIMQHRNSQADQTPASINDINSLSNQQMTSSGQNNQIFLKPSVQQVTAQANTPTSSAAIGQGVGQKPPTNFAPAETGGQEQASGQNQAECDGHDKIGCYVVRVYYDWFLVNGSCKCWKTSPIQSGAGASANSGGGNSFLRRIFTG